MNSFGHLLQDTRSLRTHILGHQDSSIIVIKSEPTTREDEFIEIITLEETPKLLQNINTVKKTLAPKQHPCEMCNKIFTKPSKLLRHSQVHDIVKKPFECLECHQRFATEQLLNRHGILHSDLVTVDVKLESHICLICSKEFSSQEAVSSHLKSHKEELKNFTFACECCDKIFTKFNDLTKHSKTHDIHKSHQCNICQKVS